RHNWTSNREEVIEMGVLGYNAEKHLQVIQDESFDTVFDLYEWLFDNDRVSDAKRASKDREFRKQLLEEYASASKNE
nr:hypothetical protein [Butyrivibrio sp.]